MTFQESDQRSEDHLAASPFIQLLLDTRTELRTAKQYGLADQIREGLERQGVVLEDSAEGTQWHYQSRQ